MTCLHGTNQCLYDLKQAGHSRFKLFEQFLKKTVKIKLIGTEPEIRLQRRTELIKKSMVILLDGVIMLQDGSNKLSFKKLV